MQAQSHEDIHSYMHHALRALSSQVEESSQVYSAFSPIRM